METQIAYYMFVNHGRFPGEIINLGENEKILVWQMAIKEINNRPKSK